jgi:hypothetical protein
MKHIAPTLLLFTGLALGCGGEGATQPTPRAFAIETSSEGPLAAHTSYCQDFRPEERGAAFALAGLRTPIELGTGRCAGTRSVVLRSETGEVEATLAAGDSFVRIENTSDENTRFRLTLRYLIYP